MNYYSIFLGLLFQSEMDWTFLFFEALLFGQYITLCLILLCDYIHEKIIPWVEFVVIGVAALLFVF